MEIDPIIKSKAELTHGRGTPEPIVLSTRIRLARNLKGHRFPGWAKDKERLEIFKLCKNAASSIKTLDNAITVHCEKMSELEKQVLVERHLISPEFAETDAGSGVIVTDDQKIALMINEEDHIRMQIIRSGFKFKEAWKALDSLDSKLEKKLNYAFSDELGYYTACPTNLGTGLRASVMLHLPGLVIAGHIEKVIRAVNQMHFAVRGLFGEGSDASGSIFQISNQQTLGESEENIIRRLSAVLETIIEQEKNARKVLLEEEKIKVFDKIGRAFGILRNGYFVNSSEAMNLLSLMRLAVDLNIINTKHRRMVDRLFIEAQPGHLQFLYNQDIGAEQRDSLRANLLRQKFKTIKELHFSNVSP